MDIKKIEVVNIKQHQATNLACGDPGDVQGVKNYRFRTVTYQNKKTLEQCESLPQYIYIYILCILYMYYIYILYIYIRVDGYGANLEKLIWIDIQSMTTILKNTYGWI